MTIQSAGTGVYVGNGAAFNASDLDITTTGDSTYGMRTYTSIFSLQPTIAVSGNTLISTSGQNATGVQVGAGSLSVNDLRVTTTGDNAIGLNSNVSNGFTASGDVVINTSGNSSDGVHVLIPDNTGWTSAFGKSLTVSTTGLSSDALMIAGAPINNFTPVVLTFDSSTPLPALSATGAGSSLIHLGSAYWRSPTLLTLTDKTFSMDQSSKESWGIRADLGANVTLAGSSDLGGTGVWMTSTDGGNGANVNGTLTLQDSASLAGSRVALDGSSRLSLARTDNAAAVGSLEGTGRLAFAAADGTLTLGQDNATVNGSLADEADFSGSMQNVGTLTKTGRLTQILSGVNTVGSVDVQDGTLQFGQSGAFTTSGDYTTASGATTDTGRNGSVLQVNGAFTQAAGASLTATVNSGSPAIVADHAVLDGTLNLQGFSFSTGGAPAKASAISGTNYVLISTANGITGNFTNDISQATNLDYLTQSGGINGNNYTVGFQTAWDNGGKTRGTGSFTLAKGSTFEYDTALADQTLPAGGFDSGWNGKSLTKAGDGTLILSAANTYTGGTTLNVGTLALAGSGTLGGLTGTTTVKGGTLDLGTTTQTQSVLAQSGGVLKNGILDLGTYRLTGGGLNADATVKATTLDLQAGSIDGVLDGGSLTKSTAGNVTLSNAATTVDSVDVQGGTLAFIQQNAAFTTTSDYTTRAGATTDIGQNGSTLAVGGEFTQEKDATLNLTLGGGAPAITAATATLDGTLNSNFVAGTAPAKSGDVAKTVSTLIHTTGGISGDFTNSQAMQTDLDYLQLDGRLSADGRDYLLGYHMAWDEGGTASGTGRFTLAKGKTFEVNTALADQTVPSGGFDSGWDGRSLNKAGDGTLILSAANTYDGGTTLSAGTLALAGSGTLGDTAGTTTVNDGTLDLGTTTQTQATLNQTGGIVKNGILTLGTYQLTGGSLQANATVHAATLDLQAGTVVGGLDGGTLTKSGDGTVMMTGAAKTVDSAEVQGGTLQLGQSGAFSTTGDYTTRAGGTTDIGQNGSTLAVGGTFTQSADATLKVTLNGTDPAVTAASAVLDGSVVFNGFSDTGEPVKASDIADNRYLLLTTTDSISGALSTVDTAMEMPDYLKGTGMTSDDGKAYYLKNMALSWRDGGQTSGTGSFTMAAGTTFNVDTVLADQIAPASGFNSGWDGRSLTKSGDGTLILSAINTYTGSTLLDGGTLRTDAARTLDSSSGVVVNAGTLDLNGQDQTANRLAGTGGQVVLNGATLTVNNAGQADNTQYAGGITDGQGTGSLTKSGDGTLTLSGMTGWTGATRLEGGALVLDGAAGGAQLVSDVIGAAGTHLSLINGAGLTGIVDPTDVSIGTGSTWNMTGDSLVNNLTLDGSLQFAAPAGHTLTVSNWTGNGGTVVLNTVLGNDQSATDKIVINGGQAAGDTALQIRHGNDNGAQTVNGIRVVETVNGGTTTPGAFRLSAASDGYRSATNTVAAGAYDYSLVRGGVGGQADDWYLVSQQSYRPETGAYLNNKWAASTMQNHTLHDRSDADHAQGVWLRIGGETSERDGAGGQALSGDTYRVHLGGDVLNLAAGAKGSLVLGVMGQYGKNNNEATAHGMKADGSVSGYSLGLYGTWYADSKTRDGAYVDTWVMSGKFDNTVSGQGLSAEHYDSRNTALSLEAGYRLPVYRSGAVGVSLEPQAQVIYSDYQADAHREHNGTVVSDQTEGSATTRVGLRVSGNIRNRHRDDLTVFAETNWWHGPDSQRMKFDGETVKDALPADRLEGKVGVRGSLSKSVSLWGSLGAETGAKGYAGGTAQIGMKYTW